MVLPVVTVFFCLWALSTCLGATWTRFQILLDAALWAVCPGICIPDSSGDSASQGR